ncbi:hypothetical protein B0H66DRAFT_594781 [Apodospora peruviana]|uniref:DUF6536 domain-containing protein n=1 Tax=Apodospora peruviana TaxID=516989 RepID=A0AAE0M0T5_9PEZI|nr:hypothetical protein B0H66DRAFT_594781 [Apodospora peruviana]
MINTAVLFTVTATLTGFLGAAVQASGVDQFFTIFTGDCDTTSRMDIGLHLLFNAFSTAVLASSSFFSQILNAPSRQEIDDCHAKGKFLHIGISSWRNTCSMAKWKTVVAWLVLLLSSTPMHLFFNSAIFGTDRREAKYHLTVASEEFVHGAKYFAPGAGLWHPFLGLFGYGDMDFEHACASDISINNFSGYCTVDIPENTNEVSCAREYASCHGAKKYRDLVVVVEKNSSWARNSLWDFNNEVSRVWDSMWPQKEDNSLWSSASCILTEDYAYSPQQCSLIDDRTDGWRVECGAGLRPANCANTCSGVLGPYDTSSFRYRAPWSRFGRLTSTAPWITTSNPARTPRTVTVASLRQTAPGPEGSKRNATQFGARPGTGQLSVAYCLAEPITQQCSVMLSKLLPLIVTVCVLVKTLTCALVVTVMRRQDPLVTLGDTIESFVVTPDAITIGEVPISSPRQTLNIDGKYHQATHPPDLRWQSKAMRGHSSIDSRDWVLGSAFIILAALLTVTFVMDPGTLSGLFSDESHDLGSITTGLPSSPTELTTDTGNSNVLTTIQALLAVGGAQSILSLWYLLYGQLLTQSVMAHEWASSSTGLCPLRVTSPHGRQVPKYFTLKTYTVGPDSNLPDGAALEFRFSNTMLLIVLSACLVTAVLLIGIAHRKIPGHMPPVGTNTCLIAAACHLPPLSMPEHEPDVKPRADLPRPNTNEKPKEPENEGPMPQHEPDVESRADILSSPKPNDESDESQQKSSANETERRIKISRGLLTWGMVPNAWRIV